MSTHIENTNLDYIVNLTTAIYSMGTIQALKELVVEKHDDPSLVFIYSCGVSIFEPGLPAIRKMTGETLGKIICYGTDEGLHKVDFDQPAPRFINFTGSYHLHSPYRSGSPASGYPSKHALENMALIVVRCFLRDIVMQEVWQECWKEKDGKRLERFQFIRPRVDDSMRD